MKTFGLFLILFLGMVGCSTYEEHFKVADQSFQDANAECRYQVFQTSQNNRFRNRVLYSDCMVAKGYDNLRWPGYIQKKLPR